MRNFDYGVYIFGDGNVQRPMIHNMKFQNIWVRGIKSTHAQWVWDRWDEACRLAPGRVETVLPHDGRIQYCLFVNDRPKENTDDEFGGDYISGIDMACVARWTISDNTFADIRGHNGGGRGAIFVWMGSREVIAERNVIVNCDRGISSGNPSGEPPHMTGGIARPDRPSAPRKRRCSTSVRAERLDREDENETSVAVGDGMDRSWGRPQCRRENGPADQRRRHQPQHLLRRALYLA